MTSSEIISKTAAHVREKFLAEGSGHDWWHINRVWRLAQEIAAEEGANMLIVELAALLHDIADYKFHGGDEEIGGRVAREWLQNLDVQEHVIEEVVHIVNNISFKGNAQVNHIGTLEGKVVQDADRLDAMGAIGIARAFAYGGNKGNVIHDPEVKIRMNMSKEDYKKNNSTQVNHFYEKLLLLRDLMHTRTGKKLAAGRHKFMEQFLDRFFLEWDGKA
jgi:uncharacterized protein